MNGSYMIIYLFLAFFGAILFILFIGFLFLMKIVKEANITKKANCLLWRYPGKDMVGMVKLELIHLPLKAEYEPQLKELEKALVKIPNKGKFAVKLERLRVRFKELEAQRNAALSVLPGGDWYYKYSWLMGEKTIKWCKEEPKAEGDGFNIVAYEPDEELEARGEDNPTSSELAEKINWEPAIRLLKPKAPVLEKIAQGGVGLLGISCLVGIMMLIDMLGPKGG